MPRAREALPLNVADCYAGDDRLFVPRRRFRVMPQPSCDSNGVGARANRRIPSEREWRTG